MNVPRAVDPEERRRLVAEILADRLTLPLPLSVDEVVRELRRR